MATTATTTTTAKEGSRTERAALLVVVVVVVVVVDIVVGEVVAPRVTQSCLFRAEVKTQQRTCVFRQNTTTSPTTRECLFSPLVTFPRRAPAFSIVQNSFRKGDTETQTLKIDVFIQEECRDSRAVPNASLMFPNWTFGAREAFFPEEGRGARGRGDEELERRTHE